MIHVLFFSRSVWERSIARENSKELCEIHWCFRSYAEARELVSLANSLSKSNDFRVYAIHLFLDENGKNERTLPATG